MMTRELVDSAMKDYAKGAKEVYGDKLKDIILFGSCARGDFDDESDVDVMILLDIEREDERVEREKIHPVVFMLDEKYGYELLFSTLVRSYKDFNYWLQAKPFYMNVRKDGISYV